jgi:hypothetical protein
MKKIIIQINKIYNMMHQHLLLVIFYKKLDIENIIFLIAIQKD